ncbi:MAG: hypothetical protein ACAH59_06095 [Pseudobdellovibrionaceae bacterium]
MNSLLVPLLMTAALSGEWQLAGLIYKGSEIQLPSPELNLRWSFYPNGTERLYWDRGTEAFCESFANYQLKNGFLESETFALNPQNDPSCAKDPDMQLGRKTKTKIEIQESKILLHLQLGDEELIYVLKEARSHSVTPF